MNIGLLKGIIRSLEYSSDNIDEVLRLENNNLNHENGKRLNNSLINLHATINILTSIVNEYENKSLK